MIEFRSKNDVPKDFAGVCYVFERCETRWYVAGRLHREDGPAVINNNGSQEWYWTGAKHRLDGPAVTVKSSHYVVGKKTPQEFFIEVWWFHGKKFDKKETFEKDKQVVSAFFKQKMKNIFDS